MSKQDKSNDKKQKPVKDVSTDKKSGTAHSESQTGTAASQTNSNVNKQSTSIAPSGISQKFSQNDTAGNSNTVSPYQAMKNTGNSTPYQNYAKSANTSTNPNSNGKQHGSYFSSTASGTAKNTSDNKQSGTSHSGGSVSMATTQTTTSSAVPKQNTSTVSRESPQSFSRNGTVENSNTVSPYQAMKNTGNSTPYQNYAKSLNTSTKPNSNGKQHGSQRSSTSSGTAKNASDNKQSGTSHSGSSVNKAKGTSTPYRNYASPANSCSYNRTPGSWHQATSVSRQGSRYRLSNSASTAVSPPSANPNSNRGNSGTISNRTVRVAKNVLNFSVKAGKAVGSAVVFTGGMISPFRQTQLHFTKVQTADGKYKTKAQIVNSKDFSREKHRGVLNKTYHLKDRLKGDVPSLTNKLNSLNPKTKPGKVGAFVVRNTYQASKATFKAALRVEGAALFTKDLLSTNKQLQFHFNRVQTANGKFRTKLQLVNSSNFDRGRGGALHRLNALSKTKFQGDILSLTKKLNSVKPKTIQGKVGITAVKGGYKLVKTSGKLMLGTALAAESGALVLSKQAVGVFKRKASEEFENQDTGKALLKLHAVSSSASKIIVQNINGRKFYKAKKTEYKQKKKNLRLHKKDMKQRLEKEKLRLKNKKQIFLQKKKSFSKAKSKVKKKMLKRHKEEFKASKKEFAKYQKTAKKLQKSYKKQLKSQKKSLKLNREPKLIISLSNTALTSALSSYANKLLKADSQNDTLAAVDKSVQLIKKAHGTAKSVKLKKAKKAEKRHSKNVNKNQAKLKEREQKLKQKSEKQKSKKKKYKKKKRNKVKDYVNKVAERIKETVKAALQGVIKEVMTFLLPIIGFAVMVLVVLFIIQAFLSNASFMLGTYTADDEQLTNAVEVYTSYANQFHKSVYEVNDNSKWKTALTSLGINCDSYKTKPNEYIYGRCSELDYDPAEYDFDPYILWSFLSAYYYDFDKSAELKAKGKSYTPEYWEVDNETKALLGELFYKEYTFEHKYIDGSYWKERENYIFEPYCFAWRAEIQPSHFSVHTVPDSIRAFIDSNNHLHFDTSTVEIGAYEVLDYSDPSQLGKKTGWFVLDERYSTQDSNHRTMSGVYYPCRVYGCGCGGNGYRFDYWNNGSLISGHRGSWSFGDNQIYFAVTRHDTEIITESEGKKMTDVVMVKFYKKYDYVEESKLYYNVRRNCTFKEAAESILKSMSYSNERMQYFNLLVGDDTISYHGNHQCMRNPVDANMQELINSNRIYNGYAYDIDKWNSTHCDIGFDSHNGLDISCGIGENIYAMLDGEVTDVDGNSVTILAKNFELVYSTDNEKSRKYNITVKIVNVSPSVSKGDKVATGDIIGTATSTRKCNIFNNSSYSTNYIHVSVQIEKAFFRTSYIDPRMLIY